MFSNFKALSIAASATLAAVGAIAIHPTAAQAQTANLNASEMSYLADFDRALQTLTEGRAASVFGDTGVAIEAVGMGYATCNALDSITVKQLVEQSGTYLFERYSNSARFRFEVYVRSAALGSAVRKPLPKSFGRIQSSV